jgi:uncharacterized protein
MTDTTTPTRTPEVVVVTGQRPPRDGVRPAFAITVDGQDRTAILQERLLSITLTDNSGGEADTLELTFDDSHDETLLGGAIESPRKGVWLEFSLGYIETGLVPMGRFIVDETEYSGPPDLVLVRARATDLRGSADSRWKAQKTRSHRATSVGALVAKIAAEHGQEPVVDETLKPKAIAHIDQTNESDLHFLTRLARREGAIFSLKGGKAIFAKAGTPRTASGREPSTVTLTRPSLKSWRLTLATRGSHGSIITKWRDRGSAKIVRVTAGSGDPKRTLRTVYESEAAATRAGEAELARLGRAAKGALELELVGRATLAAGSRLTLEGVRAGIDGDWVAKTVEHRLDWSSGGYSTRVEGGKP